MRSFEQERLRRAYEFVREVKGKSFEESYSSLVKRLPSMISHNGLITTLAFLRAKGKKKEGEENAHSLLLKQLTEYFNERFGTPKDYEKLVEELSQVDVARYLWMSKEMVSFSTWLKRMAEGLLKDEG